MTRVRAVTGVAAIAAALSLVSPLGAQAEPTTCPPNCDAIPPTAWVDSAAIPLFDRYRWPNLATVAVAEQRPRFYFEDMCLTAPAQNDPRAYAVAAKAFVPNPPGQWQLQSQVLHWRGESWYGGQLADQVVNSAATALRACQASAPHVSPSITTEEPGKLAAVLTVAGTPTTIVHAYLVSHPLSSTVVELAMWALSPPAQNWPTILDTKVLDALIAPLCVAYLNSCR